MCFIFVYFELRSVLMLLKKLKMGEDGVQLNSYDNCCFNRPFDDQSQLRILLETEAKLNIQENIRSGIFTLIWSYVLDYENSKNPFRERKEQIEKWRAYSEVDIEEENKIIEMASAINAHGINKFDSLRIACAIYGDADYFLTTDDRVLEKSTLIHNVTITDPIGFIKELSL